jgi:hypothetical protein
MRPTHIKTFNSEDIALFIYACEAESMPVRQLGSRIDTDLLCVWSGSKLVGCIKTVANWMIRVWYWFTLLIGLLLVIRWVSNSLDPDLTQRYSAFDQNQHGLMVSPLPREKFHCGYISKYIGSKLYYGIASHELPWSTLLSGYKMFYTRHTF